jgi:hypothetical protein
VVQYITSSETYIFGYGSHFQLKAKNFDPIIKGLKLRVSTGPNEAQKEKERPQELKNLT